ncbi:cell division protein FtsL [Pelagibius sp.]|uniref:cell division protein FtsL n=1 Tax=Pelagibius sp. TaxID=1931238 RepID=UPI003B510657
MRRFVIFCWVLAGSVTALTLFQIKQEVTELEAEIKGVHRDILRDQEAIHVLEAEWSYLNNPARIASLAERHLKLGPIPAERIVGFADLPLPRGEDEDGPGGTGNAGETENQPAPPAAGGTATLVTAPASFEAPAYTREGLAR